VDVSGLSSHNDGSRYLLTCIDVFIKWAWAVPVRRKIGQNVAEAFEKILADGNCKMLQSDKGTEFLNSTFQSMLQLRGIKSYTSKNEDLKAAIVERFNRTLKTKMFRYCTRFYVTLPSNSSMDCYPENSVARYTTKLNGAIELEGDWVVGLTEISFPSDIENVRDGHCYYNLYLNSRQERHEQTSANDNR